MSPLPIASASEPAVASSPASAHTFARRAWTVLQATVWLLCAGIVVVLFVSPEQGIHALWNVLIPVAPALLVLAPGVWRNVCPMATSALLPRRLGLSRAALVPLAWQGRLAALGVFLLLAIVPLRHVIFDLNGPASGIVLLALSAVALGAGVFAQGKSGWCSGLCPVHPVEKLYGQAPLLTPVNAHCAQCTSCVRPCPESIPGGHPLSSRGSSARSVSGTILIGGFPGFVYGWFQVPDYAGAEGWANLVTAYGWPLLGLVATLVPYMILRAWLGRPGERILVRVFAVVAVACYYWFRLPALVGFGVFPGDGMLIDLTRVLPAWFPIASQLTTTVLFAVLLLRPLRRARTWSLKPVVAT